MLFVHPDWRGWSRLIKYAVDTLGVTTLDVNEQNDQALGFYLRMGLGRRALGIGWDGQALSTPAHAIRRHRIVGTFSVRHRVS